MRNEPLTPLALLREGRRAPPRGLGLLHRMGLQSIPYVRKTSQPFCGMSIGIAILRIAQFLRQRVIIRLQIVDILGMSIHPEVVPVEKRFSLVQRYSQKTKAEIGTDQVIPLRWPL